MIQLSLHAIQLLKLFVRHLEADGTLITQWFSDNYLKQNDDKCHIMMFGDKCSKATVRIRNSTIDNSDYKKLLGITFDKN